MWRGDLGKRKWKKKWCLKETASAATHGLAQSAWLSRQLHQSLVTTTAFSRCCRIAATASVSIVSMRGWSSTHRAMFAITHRCSTQIIPPRNGCKPLAIDARLWRRSRYFITKQCHSSTHQQRSASHYANSSFRHQLRIFQGCRLLEVERGPAWWLMCCHV